ncbi:MAG: protein kinase [Candidatus Saccharibacteria bacterium]|nr:protein kinase [Pseudorhodobacter sp.]
MGDSRPGDIFQPGDLLNNTYRIENILGRGGTSEVYKARNEISGRFVAIKALKSEFSGDEGYLTLMRREEEIREIRHDAVVRYSENHRTPSGMIYLVMDYVEGPGLDAKMKAGGMSAPDLIAVCKRVAGGLKVAHDRRIIHRDLSPDNIILRGDIPSEAVIIDFGIAKDANPGAQTIVGNEFAGKYAYAAPEQLSGQTDARSDLYALGALLLATFRGTRPDIGANPMEVLKKKALPLNTSGVPEPLKSLIDKMTQPDPAHRFQSADDLLAAIDHGMDERTVVVPRPKAVVPPPPQPTPKPTPAKRGAGGLIAVALAAVLGLGAAGAYFGGLFNTGPTLPVANPYLLTVEKPDGGPVRASGDVPSESIATALTKAVTDLGGTADLTLATGDISETWGADLLTVVASVAPLESWRVDLTGNDGVVTGVTTDQTAHDTVMAALGTGLPGSLKGKADITLKPQFLTAEAVDKVLASQTDCGPLEQMAPPTLGYGKDDAITVSGNLSGSPQQVQLFDALTAIADNRKISLGITLLNDALCKIEGTLPAVRSGNFRFDFGFGDRPDDNPSGRYFVGENPTIDLVIPADVVDGFISVSIIDVSGNVYHVLPNMNRPEDNVATLRNGATGAFMVRLAYPLAENTAQTIAFTIDPTTLGKSKVIVVASDKPLFAELRPTTESVDGYAAALKTAAATGDLQIRAIDSRILTSVEK